MISSPRFYYCYHISQPRRGQVPSIGEQLGEHSVGDIDVGSFSVEDFDPLHSAMDNCAIFLLRIII